MSPMWTQLCNHACKHTCSLQGAFCAGRCTGQCFHPVHLCVVTAVNESHAQEQK